MDQHTETTHEAHDTEPVPAIIEAGGARLALLAALANLAHAVGEVEAVSMAIARQLDATVRP